MRIVFFVFCFLSVEFGISQTKYLIDIPTPNAAELGKYGQIPVSYFNGLPNISIPLYTIKCKDIEFPISLSYHAGGNKTETHPTWVGLGWNLNAGGSITRVIQGHRDELRKEDFYAEVHPIGAYPTNCETGYYFTANKINDIWYRESFLDSLLYSNGCMMNLDPYPDEFCFNFLGYSGSFYFVYKNGAITTKIKSKDNVDFIIEPVFSSDYFEFNILKNSPYYGEILKARVLKTFIKFILTDNKGYKYEFGGDTTNIDFSTSNRVTIATSWHLSKIISPEGGVVNLYYKNDGDIIDKKKSNYFYADWSNISHYEHYESNYDIGGLSISILHPKYLQQISTSDNQVINFKSSKSVELDYTDWSTDLINIHKVFDNKVIESSINQNLNIIWNNTFLNSHYYLKLDTILISSNPSIAFQYSNNSSQRLHLTGVSLFDYEYDDSYPSGHRVVSMNYSFGYNTNLLPDYNSRKSDNWGYYNGKDYGVYDTNQYANLYTFREPDATLMKAEILDTIHYPTGGTIVFEYEPHSYSKVVAGCKVTDTTFKLLLQVGIAGGLRIKAITTYPDIQDLTKFLRKRYYYVNSDGSSTGILSGIPQYISGGTIDAYYHYGYWTGLCYFHVNFTLRYGYYQHSQNLILPLSNTGGNHVTYSRIIEKDEDNSYCIYYYTNHEDYLDEVPVRVFTNVNDDDIYGEFTTRELERGLLKCEEKYDNSERIVSKTDYKYNTDPNRYNEFVPFVYKHVFFDSFRLSALKIYTFTPYLSEKTDTLFVYNNSTLSKVGNKTEYLYDAHKNLIESSTWNSTGDIITTKYKYPYDFMDDWTIRSMVLVKNQINVPIETVTLKNQLVTNASITKYSPVNCQYTIGSLYTGGYFKPCEKLILETQSPISDYQYTGSALICDTRCKPEIVYDAYDNYGNLRQLHKQDGYNASYVWGYSNKYPIAEVKNADSSECGYTGFENDESNSFSIPGYATTSYESIAFSGKRALMVSSEFGPTKSFAVGNQAQNHSGYKASVWVKGSADAYLHIQTGNSWDPHIRIKNTVPGTEWHLLEVELPRILIQPLFSSNLSIGVYIGVENNGSAVFDDLRFYPMDAQMTTYTYKPFVGITSSSDVSNKPTIYEYGVFNRLILTRNYLGEIQKKFDYHLK